MSKINIVKTHLETDIVNNALTVVYTDENGVEWVAEEDSEGHSKIVKKSDSWYFKTQKS